MQQPPSSLSKLCCSGNSSVRSFPFFGNIWRVSTLTICRANHVLILQLHGHTVDLGISPDRYSTQLFCTFLTNTEIEGLVSLLCRCIPRLRHHKSASTNVLHDFPAEKNHLRNSQPCSGIYAHVQTCRTRSVHDPAHSHKLCTSHQHPYCTMYCHFRETELQEDLLSLQKRLRQVVRLHRRCERRSHTDPKTHTKTL
eukprot:TRINITY_DN51368_c0_g1_i1.p2 TRINITY_DN51368_c0_g1~~TRINITY_DN51368_c0_g1_i1.p2  ORF type:complete len:197 (+),score=1.67 TRINITY_DN51368_c0_g1_i1:156-746(+)